MANILRQRTVCDGLDVDVLLSDGERVQLHFSTPPADVQTAVDAYEQRREDQKIVWEVDGESD